MKRLHFFAVLFALLSAIQTKWKGIQHHPLVVFYMEQTSQSYDGDCPYAGRL